MSTFSVPYQKRSVSEFAVDIETLRKAHEELMTAKRAKNTIESYASRWKLFGEWCARMGRQALPVDAETIRLYIAWAVQIRKNRMGTVRQTVNAIVHEHKTRGLASPLTDEIREFLIICAHYLQEKPNGRAPLTPEQIRRMVRKMSLSNGVDIRNRAILLVGFSCGWRSDELASLKMSGVRFSEEGVLLHIGRSKMDQIGKGRTVAIPYGKRKETCPVRALLAWIEYRGDWSGPLLIPLPTDGSMPRKSMRPAHIRKIVKKSLERIGVDSATYGAHSLRAGMITTAYERGSSLTSIQQRTGHKTLSCLMSYVRPKHLFNDDPLRGVL